MQSNLRVLAPQESSGSHDCASRAHTGNKGIGLYCVKVQLPPYFGTRGFFVGFNISAAGKLTGQEYMLLALRQFLRHSNASEKSSLIAADRDDLRSQAANQSHPLLAHPIRHENNDLV